MIQFIEFINIHFKINKERLVEALFSQFASLPNIEKLEQDNLPHKPAQDNIQIRESIIKFEFWWGSFPPKAIGIFCKTNLYQNKKLL